MAPLVANYIYETRRTAAVQKRERESKKITEITWTSQQTNKLSSITPGFNVFDWKLSGFIDVGIRQVFKNQKVSPQQ